MSFTEAIASGFGNNVGFSGTGNTGLGYTAGTTNSSGDNNTYLGTATAGAATLDNQTAIGYQATCTKVNQIVLGNTSVTEVLTSGTVIAPGYSTDAQPGLLVNGPHQEGLFCGTDAGKIIFSGNTNTVYNKYY